MSSTWRDLVLRLFPDAKFSPPCTASQLAEAEQELKVKFPEELRSLYLETNGVNVLHGSELVWPIPEMVAQNEIFWEDEDFAKLYMPFNCLLFFGAVGDGDQFAYRILAGEIPDTSWIYKWEHENDNRVWFARDLADLFQRFAKRFEPEQP